MKNLAPQTKALFEIVRIHDCLVTSVMTFLGAYLTGGITALLSLPTLYAALVMGLIVAVSNIANDYRDLIVDQIHKPHRPLPSGRISLRTAEWTTLLLVITVVFAALPLGLGMTLLAIVIMILGVGYSFYLKGTVLIGNGFIGLIATMPLLYGGLSAGEITPVTAIASWVFFLFVFAREILKTIADREGDAQAGLRTVATQLGKVIPLRLFQLLLVSSMVSTLLPWVLRLTSHYYLYAAFPCTILPITLIISRLDPRLKEERVKLSLRVMKLLMFTSAVPILLLR